MSVGHYYSIDFNRGIMHLNADIIVCHSIIQRLFTYRSIHEITAAYR